MTSLLQEMLLKILTLQPFEYMLNVLYEGCITWGVLNSIWIINRIEILSSSWQTFAHIVNLTNPPVGPK